MGPCNQNPQKVDLTPGHPINMKWQVEQTGDGHVYYTGSINGVSVGYTDPSSWDNQIIYPGVPNSECTSPNTDPTRVRVDGDDPDVDFGPGIAVYTTT